MKLYKPFILRKVAVVFLTIMLWDIVSPVAVFALTSGPSQPEVQSFEPAGTTDMVNLFSGDFTYNIPLFELPGPDGGYPFNIAYHSGIGMDQEASWTGLGWNLNPGVLNRQMRGLPDEFDGSASHPDMVKRTRDMKPNFTVGVGGGFAGLDLFSLESDAFGIRLSSGVEIFYNSYKGIGSATSLGISLGFLGNPDGSNKLSLNLDVTGNSQEGLSFTPSLSMKFIRKENTETNIGVGVHLNYNSRLGMTGVGFNYSVKETRKSIEEGSSEKNKSSESSLMNGSSNISLINRDFTPQVSMPTIGGSLRVRIEFGLSSYYLVPQADVYGFFNTEKIKNKNRPISVPAFGFNNLGKRTPRGMMDFNRENDGSVAFHHPILPIPSMTNDIYSIQGQGIGSMFRPYRSDFGILKDPFSGISEMIGGSFEIDLAIGFHPAFQGGLGASFTASTTEPSVEGWPSSQTKYAFMNESDEASINRLIHPYYYKSYGEMTSQAPATLERLFYGVAPYALAMDKEEKKRKRIPYLIGKNQQIKPIKQTKEETLKPRNAVITDFKNKDLTRGDEILSEFDIKYLSKTGEEKYLQRGDDTRKPHHTGGFTTLSSDGRRYVYALPAYNTEHIEETYSTPIQTGNGGYCKTTVENTTNHKVGTHYLDRTEMPPYAHSYMLTSVLGTDYIDVTQDGLTDDDLGYWVKFTYTKKESKYHWRTPFAGANYNPGQFTKTDDDMASYMYGTREQWYLASAETKTHKAVFHLSSRQDARGANSKTQRNKDKGAYSYKLDKVELIAKTEPVPIKTTHFRYSYDLCPGIDNGTEGKLTLDSIYFTYRNNTRGANNKYVFDYTKFNPSYNKHSADRWGYYSRSMANNACQKFSFPYVEQPRNLTEVEKLNEDKSAWNLERITMPSGSVIHVDYESDDYAYVQNKQAMQMTLIKGYDFKDRSVRFDLQEPISTDLSTSIVHRRMQEYLDDTKYLSFKIYTDLANNNTKEYVSGYAEIEKIEAIRPQNGKYTEGKITFKAMGGRYHPFLIAAWDHIELTRPELITTFGSTFNPNNPGKSEKKEAVRKFVAYLMGAAAQEMAPFRRRANRQKYGYHIDVTQSSIRLNSVSKQKYGGGIRVKRIVMKERQSEKSAIYGQHYEYTINERGRTISSGVAAYEPLIGGEENALKRPLPYRKDLTWKSSYNLFVELPLNESYYPGASVGYRQVKVRSLASEKARQKKEDSGVDYTKVATTGQVVHQFYTAKEFPVFTSYTTRNGRKTNHQNKHSLPIPFFSSTHDFFHATQGYSVELNDMHGKEKSVTYYAQDKNGDMAQEISRVVYNYKTTPSLRKAHNRPAMQLNNTVKVLTADRKEETRLMGVDYEYFADTRQTTTSNRTVSKSGAGNTQFFAFLPIPILALLPNIGRIETRVSTASTNKVIHRFGIMESTEVYKEGSYVKTENLYYDALTGKPLLTRTTNNYDDPIYSYTYPAHWYYGGMGGAYKNTGLRFKGYLSYDKQKKKYKIAGVPQHILDVLYQGDEYAIDNKKAYLMVKSGQSIWVDFADGSDASVGNGEKQIYVTRSGHRNQLVADVGSIISKKNPLHH